ncbi:nicotinamide-nucleotide amidohydrolase family protein [Galbitalea soli]|uniref:Nicotinamide-nucleotide amidohydrolase family protein n=1 Tax=Galbitalea soli TaxID=1268042 RepID=A0A7C9PKR8_9MICO|nr:nicotinamide-nucleotide amidohydrolase family protein [Galbitalea soli]NEM89874.1 nicotinamide-nucleotide amidohydrolase family protein [Galbitalea soli]
MLEELARRGLTVAVAESLTGGLLVAALIAPAGASRVVRGGIVAYDTALKHSLLGVDAATLAAHGAVHPDVARSMALGVRERLAVAGVPASIGLATTGVAGPDPQDGQPVGTAYVALAVGDHVTVRTLALSGTRDAIRRAVVSESLEMLTESIALTDSHPRG